MQQKNVNKFFFLNKKFLQSEYGLKYLLSCFVNFYLIIQLFEVTRNALLLPGIIHTLIALTRDVSLFTLTIYLLAMKQTKITSFILPSIVVALFLPVLISIGNFIDNTKIVPVAAVGQFALLSLRPFIFLYILCNLDSFYVFNKFNIAKTFVFALAFMVIFSFIVYFFFPALISKFNIENRIGLGNMSVQSGMYLCAYIICFYYFPFKSNKLNWLCILILLLGILLSVCSTGIICTLMVTFLFLFEHKTRKRSTLIIIISVITITLIVIRYYSLLKPFIEYSKGKAEDSIDLILNFGSNKKIKSTSFNARTTQIQNMLQNNNTPIDYLFGHGYFSVNIPEHMVENGYYEIYFACGFFGIFILSLIYLKIGLKSLKLFFLHHHTVELCAFGTLALFMVTLCIIDLPTLSLSFIILFYILFYQN